MYDDNLFWEADAVGDFFVRITPAVIAQHRSPTLTLLSSYTFDAERYLEERAVSTPMARQRALVSATGKPNAATTWLVEGAFATTSTPVDFNVITGLAPGRFRAYQRREPRGSYPGARSHDHVARRIHACRCRWRVTSPDIDTNGVDFSATRRFTTRDGASARVALQRFGFDPGKPSIRRLLFSAIRASSRRI